MWIKIIAKMTQNISITIYNKTQNEVETNECAYSLFSNKIITLITQRIALVVSNTSVKDRFVSRS